MYVGTLFTLRVSLDRDADIVCVVQDATLTRCFGVDKKIIDCNWEYLSTLRTLNAPHEPMPRLKDLLEYLAAPEAEHLWLLFDIKVGGNLVWKLVMSE